jgi:phage shock protein A
METFDLTGIDPESAKEIVLRVIASRKETTRQRMKLEEELGVWRSRVDLAAQAGKSDLEAAARTRVVDLEFQLDGLRAEETELSREVDRLKQELRRVAAEPKLTVDADALLASLAAITGERDELADAFREEEANDLLEKLKSEMQGEDTAERTGDGS